MPSPSAVRARRFAMALLVRDSMEIAWLSIASRANYQVCVTELYTVLLFLDNKKGARFEVNKSVVILKQQSSDVYLSCLIKCHGSKNHGNGAV